MPPILLICRVTLPRDALTLDDAAPKSSNDAFEVLHDASTPYCLSYAALDAVTPALRAALFRVITRHYAVGATMMRENTASYDDMPHAIYAATPCYADV